MITTFGKKAVAKFLADTINSPFEYMALGCGVDPGDTAPANPTSLAFETVRAPILETSAYEENSEHFLSFSAVVPTELRYEFTEIGIYPSKTNNAIASPNSSLLFLFTPAESWEIRSSAGTDSTIPSATTIDSGTGDFVATTYDDDQAIYALSSDQFFFYSGKSYQSSRVGNYALLVRGNTSSVLGSPGSYSNLRDKSKLRVDSTVSIGGARYDDELALSFAVLNEDLSSFATNPPKEARIVVEFKEYASSTEYARFETKATQGVDGVDFVDGGSYVTVSAPIGPSTGNTQVVKTANFSWSNVGVVNVYVDIDPTEADAVVDTNSDVDVNTDTITTYGNHGLVDNDIIAFTGLTTVGGIVDSTQYYVIYVSDTEFQVSATAGGSATDITGSNDSGIIVSKAPKEEYFVLLDGLRFISKNDTNPNYGLVAYSIVDTDDASTLRKNANQNRRFTYTMKVDVG